MRPLLLKAHSRAITHLEFNYDGDLLFSTSKDYVPMVWRVDTGERLGTYEGHSGAVWYCNASRDSTRLLTASADATVKLWDVETGQLKQTFPVEGNTPVRCVNFSYGEQHFLSVTDKVLNQAPHVCIYKLERDSVDQKTTPIVDFCINDKDLKILHAAWGPNNRTILCSCEDGCVRVFDTETQKQIKELHVHTKAIVQLQYDRHGLLFITASRDGTAKLFDAHSYECLKTYNTGRPVNAAAISPLKDHVILGGGQSAEFVTTTSVDNAQFKAILFDLVHQDELGRIAGHFGPIHSIQFMPDGRGYASGAEDGYVRLYKFDKAYFEGKF
eukprot:TRINITY_DN18561_c0_g1_i1.p2 TRINITY_DN18561_c0_g1~~TRINITY_DN18561_c0_g1_i1.p2  ORF type:complete len:338 (-),score=90.90 TRINITY_DN18561_c0_g1_i1:60-1043(-)